MAWYATQAEHAASGTEGKLTCKGTARKNWLAFMVEVGNTDPTLKGDVDLNTTADDAVDKTNLFSARGGGASAGGVVYQTVQGSLFRRFHKAVRRKEDAFITYTTRAANTIVTLWVETDEAINDAET